MDGQRTALCISMPKGGYVPIFHVPDTRRVVRPLQVVVSAFEMEANAGGLTVGQGLARQIVVRLNRSPEVSVFASRALSGDLSHPTSATVAPDLDLVSQEACLFPPTSGTQQFCVPTLEAGESSGRNRFSVM